MTSFDCLTEKNPELQRLLCDFCDLVKCEPSKAADVGGDILNAFLTAVCADNCISFDRARNATLIAMLGEVYKCGLISAEEKAVLDELRQLAFSTRTEKLKAAMTTSNLIRVLNDFCGVLARYYDQEPFLPNPDTFKIGALTPIRILLPGTKEASYDCVFLCENQKEKRYYAVAQYSERDEVSDAFVMLRLLDPKRLWKGAKKLDYVLYYTTVLQESGNDTIFLAAEIRKDFVVLRESFLKELSLTDRMEAVIGMTALVSELHGVRPQLSLGGLSEESFLYCREKNRKITLCLNGFAEKLGKPPFGTEALAKGYKNTMQGKDLKELSLLISRTLPEAEQFSPQTKELLAFAANEEGGVQAATLKKCLIKEYKSIKKEAKKEGKR